MPVDPRMRAAMGRRLLSMPAIQPPGGRGEQKPTGGSTLSTGKDYNTGKDRWYIPNYGQRSGDPRAEQQYIAEARYREYLRQQLINTLIWRDNNIGRSVAAQVLKRRPQDEIADVPAFGNTGVDEGYMGFKNFQKFGVARPPWDPTYGTSKGYG